MPVPSPARATLAASRTPDPALRSPLRRALHLAAGVAVLVAALALGQEIVTLAALAIPGSVVGMVLLVVALRIRLVPLALVRPAADLLLRYLALLYVPAGVGIVLYVAVLRRAWLPVTLAALASLAVTLVVAGTLVQRGERRTRPAPGAR